jgi:hypothetical protein
MTIAGKFLGKSIFDTMIRKPPHGYEHPRARANWEEAIGPGIVDYLLEYLATDDILGEAYSGTHFSLAAKRLNLQIGDLLGHLNSLTTDVIAGEAVSGTPYSLSVKGLHLQLADLVGYLNALYSLVDAWGGGGGGGDLAAHLADPVGAHAASAISKGINPAWADGGIPSADDVEVVINAIIANLADKTGSTDGSGRVGAEARTGGLYTLAQGSVKSQIVEILGHLQTISEGAPLASQEAIGGILVDTDTIDFTYDDVTPQITADVKDGSITNLKLRESAGFSVIGRGTTGTGAPVDIVAGSNGVLRRSSTGSLLFSTLVTGNYGLNSVTNTIIRDSVGASVIGRSAGTTGDPADISASADHHVLRRSGGTLGFGLLLAESVSDFDVAAQGAVGGILADSATIDFTYDDVTPQITATVKDNSISNSLLRDSSGFSVIGKATTGAGDPVDIVAGSDGVLRRSGSGDLAFGTLVTNHLGDNQVTFAKVQTIASDRLLGRSTAGAGNVETLTLGSGLVLSAGALSLDVGTLDHGALSGLADDDHPGYFWLSGRVGGQTLIGGTAAGDDLTFRTSSGDPGSYIFAEMTSAGILKNSSLGVVTGGNTITSSEVPDFEEAAQDAVGGILVDSGVINLVYDDVTPKITAEINTNAVIFPLLQQIGTDLLLGRDAAGTGNVETLTVSGGVEFTGSGGIRRSALTGDVTASAGNSSLTIAANAVTNTKLRDSSALSVIGRADNSVGDPTDLVAGTDGHVLRRSGTTLGFGTLVSGSISNFAEGSQDAVGSILVDTSTIDFTYDDVTPQITADVKADSITNALLRDSSGFSVIGRGITGTGDPTDLLAGADQVLRRSGSGNLEFGTLVTNHLGDNQVTLAKVQTVASGSLLGRAAVGTGNVEALLVGGGLELVSGVGPGEIRRSELTGDVTASAGDDFLTISDNAVTNTKLRDSAPFSVIGRSGSGTGDPSDIVAGATSVLRRGSGNLEFGTLVTGHYGANSVTDTVLRDSAALSVIGRSANSTGDPADISAGTDGHVLRRSGATLGFGTLLASSVSDFVEAAQDAVGSALVDSLTIDFVYEDHTIKAEVIVEVVDHNSLANLAVGDAHTQYVRLAGRAGGQIVRGGLETGDELVLRSTEHATKGAIRLEQASEILLETVSGGMTLTPSSGNVTIDSPSTHARLRVVAPVGYETGLDLKIDTITVANILHSGLALSLISSGGMVLWPSSGAVHLIDMGDSPTFHFVDSGGVVASIQGTQAALQIQTPGSLIFDASEVDAGAVKIVNVTDPTDPQDVATKAYVDLSGGGYTDEDAQDAVGSILVDTATIDFTYDDSGNQITADVKSNSITFTQFQQIGTDLLLGRDTAGTGNVETLSVSGGLEFSGGIGGGGGILRSALTGDVTANAGSNATTIAANVVSNTKLRDSVALSVIGRSANSTGDPSDIVAGTDGHILRRSGTTLGFGTVSHNLLTDLTTGDAHTHYLKWEGRTGGQSIFGGITSGDDLDLYSTAHATPGEITLHHRTRIGGPVGTGVWDPSGASTEQSRLYLGKDTGAGYKEGFLLIPYWDDTSYNAIVIHALQHEETSPTSFVHIGGGMTGGEWASFTEVSLYANSRKAYFHEIDPIELSPYTGEVRILDGTGNPKLSLMEGSFGRGAIFYDRTAGSLRLDSAGLIVAHPESGRFVLLDSASDTPTLRFATGGGDLAAIQVDTSGLSIQMDSAPIKLDATLIDVAFNKIVNLATPTSPGDAATKDYVDSSGGGVTAHNELTGLSNDDHAIYALLAGRSGGQVFIGGTASGNDLELRSTSHTTKGRVFADFLAVNPASAPQQSTFLARQTANALSGTNVTLENLAADFRISSTSNGWASGIKFTVGDPATYTGTAAIIAERTGAWSQGRLHFAVNDSGVSGKTTIPILFSIDGPNGLIDCHDLPLTNVADPVNEQDVATRRFVDSRDVGHAFVYFSPVHGASTQTTGVSTITETSPLAASTSITSALGLVRNISTGSTSGNVASWVSTLMFYRGRGARLKAKVVLSSVSTLVRSWLGFFNADPVATDTDSPATHLVAFRYSSTVGSNIYAVVSSGGTPVTADTGVAPSTSSPFEFEIVMGDSSAVFLINGAVVATLTTGLPATTTLLAVRGTLRTLTGAQRIMRANYLLASQD